MAAEHPTVHFPNSTYLPVAIDSDRPLSIALTLQNSPILFGCRTGICGTCLVSAAGNLSAPTPEEQEVLDILAPKAPTARLACQIQLTGDCSLTPLKP